MNWKRTRQGSAVAGWNVYRCGAWRIEPRGHGWELDHPDFARTIHPTLEAAKAQAEGMAVEEGDEDAEIAAYEFVKLVARMTPYTDGTDDTEATDNLLDASEALNRLIDEAREILKDRAKRAGA